MPEGSPGGGGADDRTRTKKGPCEQGHKDKVLEESQDILHLVGDTERPQAQLAPDSISELKEHISQGAEGAGIAAEEATEHDRVNEKGHERNRKARHLDGLALAQAHHDGARCREGSRERLRREEEKDQLNAEACPPHEVMAALAGTYLLP